MKNIKSFTVKSSDERPARRDGICFYCRQKIGDQHEKGCVIRSNADMGGVNKYF